MRSCQDPLGTGLKRTWSYNPPVPELPEVEVLRRSLAPHLLGREFCRLEVRNRALREPVRPATLRRHLLGRRVVEVGRRAKYLLIGLERESTLVLHLGMSGRVVLTEAAAAAGDHEHLRFFLDDGRVLRFRDPRRFGLAFALPTGRMARDRHFAALGPEPLDAAFDGATLETAARRRHGPVKSFLMNAAVVVGVGNIYACEALYRAGIHPRRSVARIAPARWSQLAAAVRGVLFDAIGEGGTTLNDFADGEGRSGYFQVSLAVYGREDAPCRRCGRAIRRVVLAGRSTFYCPGCQR